MNWNPTVIKQWFALILGSPEIMLITSEWITEQLMAVGYVEEGIWIKEAIYVPGVDVLQVVASVPSADYATSDHVTKEQYVRVMSQAAVLATLLSPSAPDVLRKPSVEVFSRDIYYVAETTRWKRLVRFNDPFVCQIRLSSVRSIRQNVKLVFDMVDGPFEGTAQAAYLPGHSTAIAEEGLEAACHLIWSEIVSQRLSQMAFRFTRRASVLRLNPVAQYPRV